MDRGPFRGIRAAAAAALVVRARLVRIGASRRYDIKVLLLIRLGGDVSCMAWGFMRVAGK